MDSEARGGIEQMTRNSRVYTTVIAYVIATVILYILASALLLLGEKTLATCIVIAMACLVPICIIMLIAEKIDERKRDNNMRDHR